MIHKIIMFKDTENNKTLEGIVINELDTFYIVKVKELDNKRYLVSKEIKNGSYQIIKETDLEVSNTTIKTPYVTVLDLNNKELVACKVIKQQDNIATLTVKYTRMNIKIRTDEHLQGYLLIK